MKNYLLTLTVCLMITTQVLAMAAKNADAARDTAVDEQTDVTTKATTPLPPVPIDESQATLDQSISRRGAMDPERMAQRREARKANREVASRARDIALQTDKFPHAPVSGTVSGTIRK